VDRVFLHNTLQDSETVSSEMVPGGRQGNSPFVTSPYGIYVGGKKLCFEEKFSTIRGVARRERMVRLPQAPKCTTK